MYIEHKPSFFEVHCSPFILLFNKFTFFFCTANFLRTNGFNFRASKHRADAKEVKGAYSNLPVKA